MKLIYTIDGRIVREPEIGLEDRLPQQQPSQRVAIERLGLGIRRFQAVCAIAVLGLTSTLDVAASAARSIERRELPQLQASD